MADAENLNRTVDWTNRHDQASVIASLVNSVYDMEKTRRGKRVKAKPSYFQQHFQSCQELVDDGATARIFGAEFVHSSSSPPLGAPLCVVAFRGAILTSMSDFKLNLSMLQNKLYQEPRFQKALKTVLDAIEIYGFKNVWIAGHSLGAAIALIAGKKMAKNGVHLEAFLFNPPFVSFPNERMVRSRTVMKGFRFVRDAVNATLAVALKRDQEAPLKECSQWLTRLFVNPHDHLCSGYMEWFERRKRMASVGGPRGWMESVAAQHSLGSLVLGAFDNQLGEATHLIPSAHVTVNNDREGAHGISQWLSPNISRLYTETYTFPQTN